MCHFHHLVSYAAVQPINNVKNMDIAPVNALHLTPSNSAYRYIMPTMCDGDTDKNDTLNRFNILQLTTH